MPDAKGKLAVRVSVPYVTKWGQNIRLVTDQTSWDASRGLPLECKHEGDALIWTAELAFPRADSYTYRYVVVNEAGTVEDAESRPRTVELPPQTPPGSALQIADEWQACDDRPAVTAD